MTIGLLAFLSEVQCILTLLQCLGAENTGCGSATFQAFVLRIIITCSNKINVVWYCSLQAQECILKNRSLEGEYSIGIFNNINDNYYYYS